MSVYLETPNATVLNGDVIALLRADELGYDFALGYGTRRLIADNSIDAIVTDPPYGLADISPKLLAEAVTAWARGDRELVPNGRGFMGKEWDAFVPPPAVWDEAMRVLKPGGHVLAFAGSRTHDLMQLSIRLAGFEIRDSIAWLYASGFPKSLDVATAVDKLDAVRERRTRALTFTAWIRQYLTAAQINQITGTAMGSHYTTEKEQPSVATPELFDLLRPYLPEVPEEIEALVAERAVESENWRSREVTGQHEKPAAAQTWRANVLGGDVAPPRERRDRAFTEEAREWEGWGTALKPSYEPIVVARKPFAGTVAANVMAYGTGALNIDGTRIPTADDLNGGAYATAGGRSVSGSLSPTGMNREGAVAHGDFAQPSGRWPSNVILDDATAHELDDQTGVRKSGMMRAGTPKQGKPAGILGEFKPQPTINDTYGDEGGASRFFPVFRFEAKAPTSERPVVNGVAHPTVKPLALMRWLCRLVTPRGGRVLDLFAGSGTTVEAALAEGFDVTACERETAYLPLIGWRIEKGIQPVMDIWGGDAA